MSTSVLVVDDEPEMCEMVATGLRRRGFTAEWRADAAEALGLLAHQPFDMVVTDLNMPGVDGISLCTRIAASQPDVPVIVVTAFGSLETAVAAIRAGAYDFITKPFDIEALTLTLE